MIYPMDSFVLSTVSNKKNKDNNKNIINTHCGGATPIRNKELNYEVDLGGSDQALKVH